MFDVVLADIRLEDPTFGPGSAQIGGLHCRNSAGHVVPLRSGGRLGSAIIFRPNEQEFAVLQGKDELMVVTG